MSIHVNDRVKVVHADGELSCLIGAIGKVDRIHELATGRIAIVKIVPDDETCYREIVVKFPVENLEKVEPKIEIPEGAKQITKEDFGAALKEVTSPEAVFSEGSRDHILDLLEGMAAVAFGCHLKEILFKESDVVVLTENDFVRSLWDACNPAAAVKNTDTASAFDGLPVALASVIRLRGLVEILFGGSDD